MRYTVNVRRSTEDEWSDEYYSEPYIEAESKEEAEDIAAAPPAPTEAELLAEIRDLLKEKK